MSLQVWLPLNGDLTQQGLSRVEATNNGAVVNNEGKLGKCYYFGTTSSHITLPAESMTEFTEASLSFWVKILSWNTSYATLFQAGTNSNAWKDYVFGVLRNATSSTLCFTIGDGTTTSTTSCQTSALELDTWYHLTFIYNSNGDYSIYINGILNKKSHTDTIIPAFSEITKITIGRSNGNGYQSNCLMNDIRIYDHCLSAKEIKELSKGLVLHYKLDKIKQTLINAYNYPTFNTSTASAGWSHWGRTNAVGTYGQNEDKQYIFRPNQQYSHWVANASTATMDTGGYLCYQSPAFEGGYRSIQCIVKEENSLPITEEIVMPAWNGRNGGAEQNIWTSVESLGNDFYLCKCEGISQDGSNDLIGFYIGPGYKVYFSEAYCEDNKEKCTDIFSLEDFELDCSGYKNEGTPTSNLILSTDTPKYNASTYFPTPATSSYINAGRGAMVKDALTVNLWAKFTTWGNPISCTESGGWNFETNNSSGGVRFPVYISGVGYKTAVSNVLSTELANEWHMFTGTYDQTNVKIYIDGELKGTTATSSTNLIGYANNAIFIGAEAGGSTITPASNAPFTGNISDVRIYATALSAEDIAELYHTAASIDNQGNLFCGEVVE